MFPPANRERFEKLRLLNPLEAIQAWIDGSFGIGDEPAILEAIRKDFRVVMPDEDILDILCDAMGEECDASTCLKKLVARK